MLHGIMHLTLSCTHSSIVIRSPFPRPMGHYQRKWMDASVDVIE